MGCTAMGLNSALFISRNGWKNALRRPSSWVLILVNLGLIAAVVAWAAPQTWDWSRSISGWKAGISLGLLGLALLALMTQAYNPFIYFIF